MDALTLATPKISLRDQAILAGLICACGGALTIDLPGWVQAKWDRTTQSAAACGCFRRRSRCVPKGSRR